MTLAKTNIQITGMACGHCEKAVSNKIKSLNGIGNITIDLARGSAEISFDPKKISVNEMISAINSMGTYSALVASL